mgnify:CR=1 FL=1
MVSLLYSPPALGLATDFACNEDADNVAKDAKFSARPAATAVFVVVTIGVTTLVNDVSNPGSTIWVVEFCIAIFYFLPLTLCNLYTRYEAAYCRYV